MHILNFFNATQNSSFIMIITIQLRITSKTLREAWDKLVALTRALRPQLA